jgi:FHS family L-fucose permease-like MFS transporter
MAMGCVLFYPAASFRIFGIFMLAYFTLAAGMTILQVAANPFVSVLGSEDGASSRLNLSQAFNSLGTAIAPAIGALFILSDTIKTEAEIAALNIAEKEQYLLNEASAVQMPFIALAVFIAMIAMVFVFAKLPSIINETSTGTYWQALSNKKLVLGVLGIFFYVGAEVAIGSYLVNYFLELNLVDLIKNNNLMTGISEKLLNAELSTKDGKAIVGVFVTFYWSGAMIGRFIGSYLTKIFMPGKILGIFATLAVTMIVISINSTGFLSMWSILAVGLFNSIMFPTIFTLSLDGLGELKPKASGLLCTAIVGGAVIPPLFGKLTDLFGFQMALILVIACYCYIIYFGYLNLKKNQTA